MSKCSLKFCIILGLACRLLHCSDDKPIDSVEEKNTSKSDDPIKIVVKEDLISPSIDVESLRNEVSESLNISLQEKSVEIRQEDLGKTKEVNENKEFHTIDNVQITEEKENKDEINEDKPKEEKPKETGIDLKVLKDSDFEHLTQASTGATTGDWLVLFFKTNCEKCGEAEGVLRNVYERVKHKLNVAKVEKKKSSKMTFKRFDIEETELPRIYLFHHGKQFTYQSDVNIESILTFLNGGFELSPWKHVRKPYTWFEYYLEESYAELNHLLNYKKNVASIIFIAGFVCGFCVTSLCGTLMFHLLENFKDDDDIREVEATRDEVAEKKHK